MNCVFCPALYCTVLCCAVLRCAALCEQGMKLVSCAPGRVSFTLLVEPQLQNRYGTLHGGAIGELALGL
jgi:acyl-coenzyme A thioesterase PaaI-like protein